MGLRFARFCSSVARSYFRTLLSQAARKPPSTATGAPVMYPASSEQSHNTVLAISISLAMRPMGCCATKSLTISGIAASASRIPDVAVTPAQSAFTLMPRVAYSSATEQSHPYHCVFRRNVRMVSCFASGTVDRTHIYNGPSPTAFKHGLNLVTHRQPNSASIGGHHIIPRVLRQFFKRRHISSTTSSIECEIKSSEVQY